MISRPMTPSSTTTRIESNPSSARHRDASPGAWLLRRLLLAVGSPPVRVDLWNGESVCVSAGEPVARVRINDRRTLVRFLVHPEIEFGEGYTDGRIEVDGDLVQLLRAIYSVPLNPMVERVLFHARRPHANNMRGSRANIHQHYDLGNEFYRLWLDDRMLYTCAYYPSTAATLEDAQLAKMDHVCRKVALKPGERVIEAGCGWGGLALHMARRFGVTVRAFNISHEQIAYAREQAERQGLNAQVEFVEDDYRNVTGQYDAFVSVGMLEHVGVDHYRELGRIIDRCLPPHGRGLLHTIGRNRPMRLNAWVEKHIFPGGYPPTLKQMMEILEPHEFSVLDVENLRLHYAKTAAAWLERFERSRDRVAAMFDTRFVRAWRLYLAGTTTAFTTGLLQLFQVTFARPRHNEIPWNRAYLYE